MARRLLNLFTALSLLLCVAVAANVSGVCPECGGDVGGPASAPPAANV